MKAGQIAEIKVAAFPFRQYGTVPEKVIAAGKDAVSAADAYKRSPTPPGDGRDIELVLGVSVSAEINTGSRRILEFLFSPIVDVTPSAQHER